MTGESCIVLASKRALKAGDELTYNYQYYEDGLDGVGMKMKRQKCLCGSTNCSGEILTMYITLQHSFTLSCFLMLTMIIKILK
jgi:hypothetical protein